MLQGDWQGSLIRQQRSSLLQPQQSLGNRLLQRFFGQVLSLRCLQALGPSLLSLYPGARCWGLKLVFRTPKDVFTAPSGDKTLVTVACGFCQAASTNNLARTIYGLLFVPRLLNCSTRKASSILPATLFVSARSRRTRRTTPGLPHIGQSLPLPSPFGWESYPVLPPARSHSTLPTTSSIFSRSTVFLILTMNTVSLWPETSAVRTRIRIPSRPSSIQ